MSETNRIILDLPPNVCDRDTIKIAMHNNTEFIGAPKRLNNYSFSTCITVCTQGSVVCVFKMALSLSASEEALLLQQALQGGPTGPGTGIIGNGVTYTYKHSFTHTRTHTHTLTHAANLY